MPSNDENQVLESLIIAEKERLSDLRYAPLEIGEQYHGVLLGEQIRSLCDRYDLVSPFKEECLRPAGYDLTVGERYAIDGNQRNLGLDGVLTIPPYQVAVIQTFETLNIPDFLIGRWNIRVKLAYEGLLWVGGAQVDPGFRGRLACPIYNLSKVPVPLEFGQRLAMIDFVATSYTPGTTLRPFQWWTKSLLFQQYNTSLQSGVAQQVAEIRKDLDSAKEQTQKETREQIETVNREVRMSNRDIQTRIDTFLTLIFTIVAVLFTGLGIVATKGSIEPSFVSSTIWVAGVALYFACRPFVVVLTEVRRSARHSDGDRGCRSGHIPPTLPDWWSQLVPSALEIVLALVIVTSSIGYHLWNAHISSRAIDQATQQAAEASRSLQQQQHDFQEQINSLRSESQSKTSALQQQINSLEQSTPHK